MLSTPPAFILSQDQTLMLKCSTWFIKFFPLSELTLAFFLKSKGSFRVSFTEDFSFRHVATFKSHLLFSKAKRILIRFVLRMKIHWIFRVVSLFNYQGPKRNFPFRCNRLRRIAVLFRSDSFSLSQLIFLVKHFLKVFWKVFWIVLTICSFQTALLSYHSVLWFVNNFFQLFFKKF